jgi:ribosomal-protein-alanine N-acetyltransferase
MFIPPKLETERLCLIPATLDMAPFIQTAASNREISDTMISIPHPYPDGEAERYLQNKIKEFQLGKSVTFILKEKKDYSPCGLLEIRTIDWEHLLAELSFWLSVDFWGKGYMTEGIKPAITYVFKELKLNRIYAFYMVRNPASGRVLQKNDFIREGILRQRVRKWGIFEDVVVAAILREEWEKKGGGM